MAASSFAPTNLSAVVGGCRHISAADRLLTITLPWPPRALSPNARHAHWGSLARAKKLYRSACARLAREQGAARLQAEHLAVHLRFVPPDRRARDLDNLVASVKAGLDGLADVLGVDDSRWKLSSELPVAGGELGGFVRVGVTCLP